MSRRSDDRAARAHERPPLATTAFAAITAVVALIALVTFTAVDRAAATAPTPQAGVPALASGADTSARCAHADPYAAVMLQMPGPDGRYPPLAAAALAGALGLSWPDAPSSGYKWLAGGRASPDGRWHALLLTRANPSEHPVFQDTVLLDSCGTVVWQRATQVSQAPAVSDQGLVALAGSPGLRAALPIELIRPDGTVSGRWERPIDEVLTGHHHGVGDERLRLAFVPGRDLLIAQPLPGRWEHSMRPPPPARVYGIAPDGSTLWTRELTERLPYDLTFSEDGSVLAIHGCPSISHSIALVSSEDSIRANRPVARALYNARSDMTRSRAVPDIFIDESDDREEQSAPYVLLVLDLEGGELASCREYPRSRALPPVVSLDNRWAYFYADRLLALDLRSGALVENPPLTPLEDLARTVPGRREARHLLFREDDGAGRKPRFPPPEPTTLLAYPAPRAPIPGCEATPASVRSYLDIEDGSAGVGTAALAGALGLRWPDPREGRPDPAARSRFSPNGAFRVGVLLSGTARSPGARAAFLVDSCGMLRWYRNEIGHAFPIVSDRGAVALATTFDERVEVDFVRPDGADSGHWMTEDPALHLSFRDSDRSYAAAFPPGSDSLLIVPSLAAPRGPLRDDPGYASCVRMIAPSGSVVWERVLPRARGYELAFSDDGAVCVVYSNERIAAGPFVRDSDAPARENASGPTESQSSSPSASRDLVLYAFDRNGTLRATYSGPASLKETPVVTIGNEYLRFTTTRQVALDLQTGEIVEDPGGVSPPNPN